MVHDLGPLHMGSHCHLRSIRAISAVESAWKLHTGSHVLSPKYDMDAYMATVSGGETWDLCSGLGPAQSWTQLSTLHLIFNDDYPIF